RAPVGPDRRWDRRGGGGEVARRAAPGCRGRPAARRADRLPALLSGAGVGEPPPSPAPPATPSSGGAPAVVPRRAARHGSEPGPMAGWGLAAAWGTGAAAAGLALAEGLVFVAAAAGRGASPPTQLRARAG